MAKNVERLQAREAKELIRREKQLDARSNKFYLIYLFMILSLIYITDEIASTISIQFQANIVTEFFVKNMGMEYGAGLSLFSAIGFISYPVTLLIIFYRPLADKFGRKPFLVINTLCMGLGLFLVLFIQRYLRLHDRRHVDGFYGLARYAMRVHTGMLRCKVSRP